jgi:hypothetical protein
MAKAKKQKVAPEPETVAGVTNTGAPEVQASETSAPNVKTSFDVYDVNGVVVRTYSLEEHGEDAEKLANQYANKIGGKIR